MSKAEISMEEKEFLDEDESVLSFKDLFLISLFIILGWSIILEEGVTLLLTI